MPLLKRRHTSYFFPRIASAISKIMEKGVVKVEGQLNGLLALKDSITRKTLV